MNWARTFSAMTGGDALFPNDFRKDLYYFLYYTVQAETSLRAISA